MAFFDATFDRDFRPALEGVKPDLVAVCEDNFNFLTKMCLLHNRELAFEMAQIAAEHGIPAVVNSSDSTDHPELYLGAGFNRVILGELEATCSKRCASGLRPVVARPAIADLDSLPPPAWDLIDMEQYRRAWKDAHGYFVESGEQPRLSV